MATITIALHATDLAQNRGVVVGVEKEAGAESAITPTYITEGKENQHQRASWTDGERSVKRSVLLGP